MRRVATSTSTTVVKKLTTSSYTTNIDTQLAFETAFYGRQILDVWNDPSVDIYKQKLDEEISSRIEKPVLSKGIYVCPVCERNRRKITNFTTHVSIQTRSADEAMTVFVRCLQCGYKFRG